MPSTGSSALLHPPICTTIFQAGTVRKLPFTPHREPTTTLNLSLCILNGSQSHPSLPNRIQFCITLLKILGGGGVAGGSPRFLDKARISGLACPQASSLTLLSTVTSIPVFELAWLPPPSDCPPGLLLPFPAPPPETFCPPFACGFM